MWQGGDGFYLCARCLCCTYCMFCYEMSLGCCTRGRQSPGRDGEKAAGEDVCGAQAGLLRDRCCSREPAMAAGLEAPEQGREGRDAARPQRWWKERGSLKERHCVKFLAIRRPLKVAGLWATLKGRPTLKNRGLRMWGGKDLFTRLFVLICFRCSWLGFPWLQHWLYSSLPFSELEL